MSIIPVQHNDEVMRAAVGDLRQMKIGDVKDYINKLVDDNGLEYAQMLTNRVLSDLELYEKDGKLVQLFNAFQLFLTSQRVQKLETTVSETKEKSEEAMGTAVAAQSRVTTLENFVAGAMVRIAALEESNTHQEGHKVIGKGREKQRVTRTTPSMSEHAKKAGQKANQVKQSKKEKQELFQQQEQMKKNTVLTTCVL
jgi:hypothetical protein